MMDGGLGISSAGSLGTCGCTSSGPTDLWWFESAWGGPRN